MNFYLYLLLITLFCTHDCSLETDKDKLSNEVIDYETRMKDYHKKLNDNGISNGILDGTHNEVHNEVHNEIHNDVHNEIEDTRKNDPINDGRHDGALGKENENSVYQEALENEAHKTAYSDIQQKNRNRRNKKTKFYKGMKTLDEGNRGCDCKEPQNALRYDEQDLQQRSQFDEDSDENVIEGEQTEEGLNHLNRFPYKRGSAAKRRLLKKLLAANSMGEDPNVDNNNGNGNNNNSNNNKYADDYTFDDNGGNDLNSEDRSNDISEMRPAGYVLVPKQNKLIVLKSPTNTVDAKMTTLGNAHINDVPNLNQEPISAFKSNVSSLNSPIEMDSACTGGKHPNDAKMTNNDEFKAKLKADIINCTAIALDKHLKLSNKKIDDSSNVGEKSSQNVFSGSDKQALYGQSKNDLMNLNITINGVVMKDDKPREIRGNGTVKVRRPKDDMRERRFIKFPFSKNTSKKQKKSNSADEEPECSKSDSKDPEIERDSKECPHKSTSAECAATGEQDAGLTADKLSNEIVKMVSQMVRSNPHMKTLWPSLQTNKPFRKSEANTLRTTANTSSRKQVEDMLRKAMESVNDIVEKEVQSRSCVPLTKDLADFYEVILEMHAKQAKRKEQREQMLIKSENFDKEQTDMDSDGDSSSHMQCESDMDKEDKDADLHDSGIFDMMHLKKLELDREMAEARHRRGADKRLHSLAKDTSNSSLVRNLRQMYSQAFLKLNSKMESLKEAENVTE